ncbi:MAG: bifunctional phosphoserine phosphatase/homoserine phosphotransferase ThrH [Burkholderiales bacterium]|nr:bifunctional phosphoserine phosphatase/homoserine phosphotransferase ThrH [Burkholderiales bacterium]
MNPATVVCLDLEGVLVPEIWIEVARATGIAALARTTRDEPDYDRLMRERLAHLAAARLGLRDIQAIVAGMAPLAGAREFLDALRTEVQVVILSDTFYEFARPLMARLGWPTLFCHRLDVDDAGAIRGYRPRLPDQKRRAVEALRGLNFRVVAAGDSFNDATMLAAADAGVLFRPPPGVARQYPQFPVASDYAALEAAIRAAAG